MVIPKTEIIVSKGGDQLARYVLGPGDYVVGRDSGCEVVLDAGLVSRRHAKLTVNYGEWIIEDLGSSNGTFVNGKPVTHPVKVWPRQEIGIGSATIVLRQIKDEETDHSLAPVAAELRRILPPELLTPRKYDIGGVVAQGGMGAILDARDLATRRTVAMKVMLSDISRDGVLRFIEEAQVTAQLEHPNIVPVHELSVDEQDHVFYTMKFVKGATLKAVLGKIRDGDGEAIAKFPLRRLMQMMLRVCDAIAFANSKGVIHRDLKPENIMIGDFGEVLVMDWGLAKVLGKKEHGVGEPNSVLLSIKRDDATSYTMVGAVMGTPSFMAPEQAAGEIDKINAATDVYAIGAILYQILTLHAPVDGDSAEEVLEKVRRHDIAAPTSFNSPPAKYPRGKIPLPHCPGRRIPGALSAIAMKAMSLKQEDRYPTASGLKADIDAWLGGFATKAEQAGVVKQIALLIGRNKGIFGTAFAALVLVTALTGWFVVKVTNEMHRAVHAEGSALVSASEARDAQRTATERLKEAARSDRLVAEDLFQEGRYPDAFAHLAQACEFDPGSSLAAEMVLYTVGTWDLALQLSILQAHTGAVNSAEFSPDGSRIVTASHDNTARIWDAASGKLLATLQGHSDAVVSAEFSPDGSRIVTASHDRTARIWDAANGKLLATLEGHTDRISSARFSPDGSRIVTASRDETARIWDAAGGKLLATLQGHTDAIDCARFSPDGSRIVTDSRDKTARIWDAATGKLLAPLQGHTGLVRDVRFSPDGTHIVTASADGTARIWDAAGGKLLATLQGHANWVNSAQFSPDGSRIVTACDDKTARIWDAASGKLLATLEGHTDAVMSAEFSPDGSRIVTASWDKTARIWDAASGKLLEALQSHTNAINSAAFSPDGARIVTASDDHTARVWEMASGKLLATLQGHTGLVRNVRFSPDGSRIVTASADGTARIWDAAGGKLLATLQGHTDAVVSAQFSPDGSRIVTASKDKTARIWDAVTGKLLATLPCGTDWVFGAAYSPDGSRIATALGDNSKAVRIWDAASGKLLATLQGRSDAFLNAAYNPDGSRIVTGSTDKTARIWDAASGKLLATLEGHMDAVWTAAYSPDGSRIVTASWDKTARIWDAAGGKLLATLQGHTGGLLSAAYSPDGSRIVTASGDKTARIWDAAGGKLLATLQGHTDWVNSAEFSPDGSRIVTASNDKTVRIWETPQVKQRPPEWFASFLRFLGQRRFNSDGEIVDIPGQEWREMKDRSTRQAFADHSPYGQIAQWCLLGADRRPVRPGSSLTQKQLADELITSDAEAAQLERAYDLDPTHPLLQLALARFEDDPNRAEFLRRYTLKRLPETPDFLRRAAEFLALENQRSLAFEYVNRALKLRPDDPASLDLRKKLQTQGP